jgi:hypothetical protein
MTLVLWQCSLERRLCCLLKPYCGSMRLLERARQTGYSRTMYQPCKTHIWPPCFSVLYHFSTADVDIHIQSSRFTLIVSTLMLPCYQGCSNMHVGLFRDSCYSSITGGQPNEDQQEREESSPRPKKQNSKGQPSKGQTR